MFKLPTVKSAFCGCTPEEGSKIIAYIHMVGYSAMLLTAVVFSFTYETDPETDMSDDVLFNNTNKTEEETELDLYYMERRIINESFIALSSSYFNEMVFLIQVVFAVSLLLGIYMKNLDLMFSWVLLQITNVVFSQTLVTMYFVAFFKGVTYNAMFYLFFEEITLGIFEGYFIVVVNSYMKELTEVNDDNDEVLSPIVMSSSTVDLRYSEDTNNYVH